LRIFRNGNARFEWRNHAEISAASNYCTSGDFSSFNWRLGSTHCRTHRSGSSDQSTAS
jgi:hypothetical protein